MVPDGDYESRSARLQQVAEQAVGNTTLVHRWPADARDGLHVHIREMRSMLAAQMLPYVLEGH